MNKRVLTWMLVASIIGALFGAYWMASLHLLNNAGYFITIFAMIGAAIGNLALLALYKIYETYYANPKPNQTPNYP